MEKGILMVISGFSGAGKGTLVKKLLAEEEDYVLSVSMTTRKPREGEREGVDYFFTDKETFERTIAENGLIEHACYVGNYYGTPRAYVEQQLAAGKNVILEIEIQGAMNIKKLYPDSLLLFVTPPNAQELERRLKGRGTETDEVIAGRLSRAHEESLGIDAYDYIVINDDLDRCVEEIRTLVRAARREPVRMQEFIDRIREELKVYQK
ncbi:MAG: guanylate kinase [Lachnospiraceae bacterium]|jgi:guanylate kinase|nr:guanylate kinase [Lachnospiraceae bacterium]